MVGLVSGDQAAAYPGLALVLLQHKLHALQQQVVNLYVAINREQLERKEPVVRDA